MDWEDKEIHNKFRALSPIIGENQKEKLSHYFNALSFALSDDQPRIKNIAITGDYGSGKSTVIESYINTANLMDKTLTISFATFNLKHDKEHGELKDEKKGAEDVGEKEEAKKDVKKLEHERQDVEISILQQLIYHERAINLPLSRFKRIHRRTTKEFFWNIGLLIIFLSAFVAIYFSLDDYYDWKPLTKIIFGAIFIISALVLSNLTILKKIYSGYYFLGKVNLTRGEFAIKDQEDKSSKESLLNIYLDEIVYFFDVTDYQYVVIEDLDRIEHVDIFVKLREINQIINASRKNRKNENSLRKSDIELAPVKFIYAVKDTLFLKPEDRTKFFDFIIPVIPVLDYQNRQTLLENELKRLGLTAQINSQMLADLSRYITDMRVLRNIVNEFFIYISKDNQENNDEERDMTFIFNKVFALIVYKNLMPLDFSRLRSGEGALYTFIRNYRNRYFKKEYIDSKLNIEIETLEARLKTLEGEGLKQTIQRKIDDKQKIIDQHNLELVDIIRELPLEVFKEQFKNWEEENSTMLQICLRKGYINHAYMDYISLSHGLPQEVIDLKEAINNGDSVMKAFHFPLAGYEEAFLLQIDTEHDYSMEAILNHDLISFFINVNKSTLEENFKIFWNKIFDFHLNKLEVHTYIFIKLFYEKAELELFSHFMQTLFRRGQSVLVNTLLFNFLGFLLKEGNISDREDSRDILWNILIQWYDFIEINPESKDLISEEIAKHSDFVNSFNSYEKLNNLLGVLKKINFNVNLAQPTESTAKKIFEFIFEESKYILNFTNIKMLFNYYDLEGSLKTSNLTSIRQYPEILGHLLSYIDENIEIYVNDVYLKLEENIDEKLETILYLLNHKNLSLDLKKKVISKQVFKITDLKELEESGKLNNFLASDGENNDE